LHYRTSCAAVKEIVAELVEQLDQVAAGRRIFFTFFS